VLDEVQPDHEAGWAVRGGRRRRGRAGRRRFGSDPSRSGRRAAPGDASDRPSSRAPSGRVRAGRAAKIWAASAGSCAATRRGTHAAWEASTGARICKLFASCRQEPCKREYLQIPKSQGVPRRPTFFMGDYRA
jgi:hypothetical protein